MEDAVGDAVLYDVDDIQHSNHMSCMQIEPRGWLLN